MPPEGFRVPANFLRDMAEIEKIVLGNTRTRGQRVRRRRGGGGGGGASITGALCMATGAIPAATETTLSALPAGQQAQLNPTGALPGTSKVFQFLAGPAKEYRLIEVVVGTTQFGAPIKAPMAIVGADITVYNSCRLAIAPGKILQYKSIKSGDAAYGFVDVEPC